MMKKIDKLINDFYSQLLIDVVMLGSNYYLYDNEEKIKAGIKSMLYRKGNKGYMFRVCQFYTEYYFQVDHTKLINAYLLHCFVYTKNSTSSYSFNLNKYI